MQQKQVVLTLRGAKTQLTTLQAGVVFGGAALSMVGLSMGSALLFGSIRRGINATEKSDELESMPGDTSCGAWPELCYEVATNERASDSMRVGAIVGLSLGGAVALGTILYAGLAAGSGGADTAVRIKPVVAPSLAGVTLDWRF